MIKVYIIFGLFYFGDKGLGDVKGKLLSFLFCVIFMSFVQNFLGFVIEMESKLNYRFYFFLGQLDLI